ncbi:MAG: tetraacyldisaccharide 4'-kinase [Caldiserica bacterium]|nr:tetraacyldisaccharide 4'-kinase [Caldisericota bacterium]
MHDYPHKIENYPFLLKVLKSENKWLLPGLTFLSYLHYLSWLLKSKKQVEEPLPFKVIGVGNLTWGGTGKTPFVEYLARKLKPYVKVGLVTTGYGARKKIGLLGKGDIEPLTWEDIGDESLLLKEKLPDIPLSFGRNRRLASFLLYKSFQAECIILDDAFQYRRMHKDLEILLIDATDPFGNNYLIPRGKLREPYSALQRADLVIFTKTNSRRINRKTLSSIQEKFPRIPFLKGFHRARFLQRKTLPENKNEVLPVEAVKGKKVGIFSGLGDPCYFEETLSLLEAKVERVARFQDHHSYQEKEVRKILSFLSQGTDFIITTEKDALKLPEEALGNYPVYSLVTEFAFLKGEEILQEKLSKILPPGVEYG